MQKEVTTSVLKTPTAAKVGTGATFLEFNERMNCFTTPILVPSSSILSPLYSDRGVPESTNVTDPANEDRRSDQRDEDRSMLNGPDRAGHITSDEVHNTVLEDVFGNPKAQAYPNTASKIVTARTQSFVARYKQFKQTQANMNPQNMTSGGTDRAPPDVIKVPAKRKLDGVTTKEIRGFSQKSKDTAAEKLSHQEVRRSAKDAKGRAQDRKKARVTQEIGVSQSSKLSRPSSSLVQGLGQQSDKATGKLRSHAGLGGYSTATRRKANQRVIKSEWKRSTQAMVTLTLYL